MIKKRKEAILMQKRKGSENGCQFCKGNKNPTWQDFEKLRDILSVRGRILGADFTGTCQRHQRKVAIVIKQARHLALLPFTTQ